MNRYDILSEGRGVGPLHAAGDLLVGEAVAAVVDGHAPVRLRGVRLGPHHERLREGEDGAGQLVAEHLPAVPAHTQYQYQCCKR